VLAVAAGGANRNLVEQFLQYGVAVIGPPWGSFTEDPTIYASEAAVRALATAADGDIVLLMSGYMVVAVGVISGGYTYSEEGQYLDGWLLAHRRRVRWATVESLGLARHRYPLRRRACRVGDAGMQSWARSAAARAEARGLFADELPDLPVVDPPLPPSRWPRVFRTGIKRSVDLWGVIRDVRHWQWPSEAEAVALVVVPFFLDAGLGPHNIALEWHRIDVAIFRSGTRADRDCVLVVETKKPGSGVARARDQGEGYAIKRKLHVPVITTDGFTWVWYESVDDPSPASAFLPDLRTSSSSFFLALQAHLDAAFPAAQ
jgi:hypothetical protein